MTTKIQLDNLLNLILSKYIIFFITSSVFLFQVYYLYEFPANFEDSYITYRYVSALTSSGYFDWNFDGKPVYGMTGLLYPLISYIINIFNNNEILSCTAVGIFFSVASIYLMSQLADGNLIKALTVLLIAISPIFVRGSTNGLETSLVFFGIGLMFSLRKLENYPIIAAFFCCCCFLIRPDLILVVFAWIFIKIMLKNRNSLVSFIFLTGIILSIILISNYFVFSSALPLSWFIKAGGIGIAENPRWVLSQFIVFPLLRSVPLITIFLFVIWLDYRAKNTKGYVAILFVIFIFVIYQITTLPIMNIGYRFFVPILAIMAFYILACNYELPKSMPFIIMILMLSSLFFSIKDINESKHFHNDHIEMELVAKKLANIQGLFIASSEAGKLAYYSNQIKFFDTIGLNNTFVAQHFKLTNYFQLLQKYFDNSKWPDIYIRPDGNDGIGAGKYAYLESIANFNDLYDCKKYQNLRICTFNKSDFLKEIANLLF